MGLGVREYSIMIKVYGCELIIVAFPKKSATESEGRTKSTMTLGQKYPWEKELNRLYQAEF